MSNTLAFTFENTSLTILGDILNPLFIAKQICDVLGFANHKDAIKNHVDPDDIFKLEMNDRLNRKQTVNCVNESGLYALIFGSKLPKAKNSNAGSRMRFFRQSESKVVIQLRSRTAH